MQPLWVYCRIDIVYVCGNVLRAVVALERLVVCLVCGSFVIVDRAVLNDRRWSRIDDGLNTLESYTCVVVRHESQCLCVMVQGGPALLKSSLCAILAMLYVEGSLNNRYRERPRSFCVAFCLTKNRSIVVVLA